MMRDYLAVCGSSVGMERVFNISGLVCQPNRGALTPQAIRMRTMVKFYYRKLSKTDNLDGDSLLPSDARRLDEMMDDELAISDDEDEYDFMVSPRRVSQRPRARNERVIIDNGESDELAAE